MSVSVRVLYGLQSQFLKLDQFAFQLSDFCKAQFLVCGALPICPDAFGGNERVQFNFQALERLARIDEIIVDKTGTLTTGALQLQEAPDREALECAAALAANSSHPLAKAIARAAEDLQPLAPQALEVMGAGARLERTAAHEPDA